MLTGLDDLLNLKAILPTDEIIVQRSQVWSNIFDKYSFEQAEEDGVDLKDIENLYTGEEDNDCDFLTSDIEASESDSETEVESRALALKKPEEKLSYHFTPELLNELKRLFAERIVELSKLNLPFWNVCYERNEMSSSESQFSTPQFSFSSRNVRNCQKKLTSTMGLPNEINFDRININGAAQTNADLPTTISNLLAIGAGFTMKIREREYDIQVQSGSNCSVVNAITAEAHMKPTKATKPLKRLKSAQNYDDTANESSRKEKEKSSKTFAGEETVQKKGKKATKKLVATNCDVQTLWNDFQENLKLSKQESSKKLTTKSVPPKEKLTKKVTPKPLAMNNGVKLQLVATRTNEHLTKTAVSKENTDVKSKKTAPQKPAEAKKNSNQTCKKKTKVPERETSSTGSDTSGTSESSTSSGIFFLIQPDELQFRGASKKTTETGSKTPVKKNASKDGKQEKKTKPTVVSDNIINSIIISDSDESEDEFFLVTPTKKAPLAVPAKLQRVFTDDNSSSDDDRFWSPKEDTIKKKNSSKDDVNRTLKKIRKIK